MFLKLLPGEGGWSKSLVFSAGKSLLITKFLKKNPEFATGNFDVSRALFSDLPRAIFKFHGQLWANLPRAILRVSRATFEILICHGQFSSFTGTFLRFASGNKKFHGGRKTMADNGHFFGLRCTIFSK